MMRFTGLLQGTPSYLVPKSLPYLPPEMWWEIYTKTDAGTCLSMGQKQAADFFLQNQEGKDYALDQAVKNGNLKHVQMLLDMGLSTHIEYPSENWHNKHSCTLSRLAALYGSLPILQLAKQIQAQELDMAGESQQCEFPEEGDELLQDALDNEEPQDDSQEQDSPGSGIEVQQADLEFKLQETGPSSSSEEETPNLLPAWEEHTDAEHSCLDTSDSDDQISDRETSQFDFWATTTVSEDSEIASSLSEDFSDCEDCSFDEDFHDIVYPQSTPPEILEAALAGHSHVVQHILHFDWSEINEETALKMACMGGHLDICRWIFKNKMAFGISKEEISQVIVDAACQGQLRILEWLYKHFKFNFPRRLIQVAIDACQIEVIQWLLKTPHINTKRPKDIFGDIPALKRRLDILTLLAENFPKLKFTQDMEQAELLAGDHAAQKGWSDVLDWLHGFCKEEIPVSHLAMDFAAKAGHLDVCEWLHENTAQGCSVNATSDACGHGHIEVVKFLHKNYPGFWTKRAMHWAALSGHIEVVKFLHSERQEGCHLWTIAQALERNHLEVVAFLWMHRPEGCETTATVQYEYGELVSMKTWLEEGATHRIRGMARVDVKGELRRRSFDPPINLQVGTICLGQHPWLPFRSNSLHSLALHLCKPNALNAIGQLVGKRLFLIQPISMYFN